MRKIALIEVTAEEAVPYYGAPSPDFQVGSISVEVVVTGIFAVAYLIDGVGQLIKICKSDD